MYPDKPQDKAVWYTPKPKKRRGPNKWTKLKTANRSKLIFEKEAGKIDSAAKSVAHMDEISNLDKPAVT